MNIELRHWDSRIVREATIKFTLAIAELAHRAELGPATTDAIARNVLTTLNNTRCSNRKTWYAALRESAEMLRRG